MNTDFKHLDLFTPEGFRKLYDACYESLAVYAVRMTANSEAAEDIVQSVFVDLWERSDEIDDDTDIRAFLYMSVRHRALDFIRHQKVKWRYAEMLSDPKAQTTPTMTTISSRLRYTSDCSMLSTNCRRVSVTFSQCT